MYEDDLRRAIEQYVDKDYKTFKDPYDLIPYDHTTDLLKQQRYTDEKEKKAIEYKKQIDVMKKYYDEALKKTEWLEEKTMFDEIIELINEIQD